MEENKSSEEPLVQYSRPLDFERVWLLFQETEKQFRETDKKFQETDKKFQETDKQFKETDKKFQETDRQFKETDKKFQETDRQFKETDKKFQETDKQFKETDKKFKETDKKIKALSELFTSQWGKLVESLVEGDLVRLLKFRGIKVESVLQRRRGSKDGENYEFDLIAVNGEEIVIVEVKTTLRVQDVKDFRKKLIKAKFYMSEYKDRIIYGAVAFITSHANCERMAENQGLFVIRATGSSASVVNGEDFKPRAL